MYKLIDAMNALRNVYIKMVEKNLNEKDKRSEYQEEGTEKLLEDFCESLHDEEEDK